MTDKELLAVLDLSEKEQCQYFWKNAWKLDSKRGKEFRDAIIGDFWVTGEEEDEVFALKIEGEKIKWRQSSLADLAFRLRDEVVEKDWVAWQIASAQVWGATHKSEYNPGKFGNRAKPIHWIIAALLAKQEKK